MLNRIKVLREAEGWTQADLAERLSALRPEDKPVHFTTVSRLETDSLPIDERWLTDLAAVFGCRPYEIISEDRGFAEDAAPYVPPKGHYLSKIASEGKALYRVTSRALDNKGITPGNVVVVDLTQKAVDNVASEALVLVQVYESDRLEAVTLVRQFVGPSLLITNSAGANEPPIDMRRTDAVIKGVILGAMSDQR